MKRFVAILTAFVLYFAFSADSFAYGVYTQEISQIEGKRIKQILPSKYHYNCIAITEDDCLYTWGYNNGDLTYVREDTPTKKLDNVDLAVNGGSQMAAIIKNGDLYMWGANDYGNIGDGTEIDRSKPKKIMENVKFVSLSDRHSAAITNNGELYMWGWNGDGQIGDGTKEDRFTPVKIMDNVIDVSLNLTQSAVITTDGGFYIWGEGYDTKPTRIMDNVADLCLYNLCGGAVITYDRELYCWGRANGSLEDITIPAKILDDVTYVEFGGLDANTGFNGLAITATGELYSWGDCDNGQLGNGTEYFSTNWDGEGDEDYYKYGVLPSKILENVTQISCGPYHSAAITQDGSLYMWGDNNFGQLGNAKSGGDHNPPYYGANLIEYYFDEGIDSAVPVKIMDNIASVSVGCTYSTAITKDGELYTWGDNDVGQLGSGIHGGDSWKYDEGIDSNVPIKIVIPIALPGDLNSSGGEPDVLDGVVMQRILASLEPEITAADLNHDGIVNVADGVVMQRILAGLE